MDVATNRADLTLQERRAIQAAIQHLVDGHGASQVSVGGMLGVSQQAVNKILHRAEAGVQVYRALLNALRLSEPEFLARYAPDITPTFDAEGTNLYPNLRSAFGRRTEWPAEVRSQLAVIRFGDGDQPVEWWLAYGDKLTAAAGVAMAGRKKTPKPLKSPRTRP